jgi:hypothetical protein
MMVLALADNHVMMVTSCGRTTRRTIIDQP